MNRPQAHVNKLDIFFPTATAEREEGNFVGFWLAVRLNNSPIRCFILTALPLGAYSSGSVAGQSVDFCAAIIHNLVIGLFFRGLSPERSVSLLVKKVL